MALAFHRFGVLVLAKDVFIRLHIGTTKIFEPRFDPFFTLNHFFSEIVGVDVNANRTDNSKFLSHNGNGRALELPRTNTQLIVQLVLLQELTLLQIDQQIGGAVAQMPTGHIVFQDDE